MVKGLYTAYTGMINEQKRLDVLTNNLANADTNGYKKEGTVAQSFAEKLAVRINDSSNYGLKKNLGTLTLGVHLGETYTNYESGSIKVTDNQTDVAINGKGFFAVAFTNKAGETSVKYTRDGSFIVNTQGYLVTKDGDYVLNQNGAVNTDPNARIQVDPNKDIVIDEVGNMYQDYELVATIGIADFEDYNYISKYGENLYDLVDGGQVIETDAQIMQGCIEGSNVNVVDEMVKMISISRAYQAGQKVINAIDQTLEKTVNQVGKV